MLRTQSVSPDAGFNSTANLSSAIAAIQLNDSKIDPEDLGDDFDAAMAKVVAESGDQLVGKADCEQVNPLQAIGMGAQGGVWLGDLDENTSCAIKEIKKAWLTRNKEKRFAQRALTELQAMRECGAHPFITTCYTAFQTADSLLYAIELCPGGDLYALASRSGLPKGFKEADCRFYYVCLALALRHIHSRGWMYRDLKLENVLIDAQGYAKLCDFGYAKKTQELRTWTDCGTDVYAAPEQITGAGRGAAADWWSLGILLHELFTGQVPFDGATCSIIRQSIVDFSDGGAKAGEELRAAVLQAGRTVADLNSRFGIVTAERLSETAANFMRALLDADESKRIGAGPQGFLQVRPPASHTPAPIGAPSLPG